MVNDAQSKGTLNRGFHLGRLGLKRTGSYLGYQLQNLVLGAEHKSERRRRLEKKMSRDIRQELQALKGPVMKLGQMLSMQGLVSSAEGWALAR